MMLSSQSRIKKNKIFKLLVILLLFSISVSSFAKNNPLEDFFFYGVYIGAPTNPLYKIKPAKTPERIKEDADFVCKDLAKHNMNAIWVANLNPESALIWLKACEENGLRIVLQFGGPPYFFKPGFFKGISDDNLKSKTMVSQASKAYPELIKKVKNSPALLAYSICEESKPFPWFFKAMAQVCDMIEKNDPKHPAIVLDSKVKSMFVTAEKIKPKLIVRDCYSFFVDGANGPVTSKAINNYWRRMCSSARYAANSIDQPYWMMGQGFAMSYLNGNGKRSETFRYPTPNEMRWQCWSAIQEGCKGLAFFVYHGNKENLLKKGKDSGESREGLRSDGKSTPAFLALAKFGVDLKRLAPLLLTLKVATPDKDIDYWENTAVSAQTHVQRKTGRRFLILVNNDVKNIQRIGLELALSQHMISSEEKLFDLKSGYSYDYFSIKWATLLPGEGSIYFVGTPEEWKKFSSEYYKNK